ncbi:hypothetical protein J3F83DRAFT_735173 [Trichoderma novae-zelandiae]
MSSCSTKNGSAGRGVSLLSFFFFSLLSYFSLCSLSFFYKRGLGGLSEQSEKGIESQVDERDSDSPPCFYIFLLSLVFPHPI